MKRTERGKPSVSRVENATVAADDEYVGTRNVRATISAIEARAVQWNQVKF